MNEQIRQLAVKAGFPEWSHKTVGFELEQFAELIVRECAKVADVADENKCGWIGGNILIHFGVEL